MKTIYKYQLKIMDGIQTIEMPDRSQFLSLHNQNDCVTMWFVVDDPPKIGSLRYFRVVGTGHPWNGDNVLSVLGSVLQPPFVWHVMEVRDVQTN